jgi:hypothetical protein
VGVLAGVVLDVVVGLADVIKVVEVLVLVGLVEVLKLALVLVLVLVGLVEVTDELGAGGAGLKPL